MTFHPNALHAAANNAPPDTILLSSDGTSFYVHRAVLMHASANGFGGLPASPSYPGSPVSAEDDAETLAVVLGAVYGLLALPVLPWPILTRIASTLHARYGVALPATGSPLCGALAAHVFRPGGPQDVYAFAGQHDYEALAVAASEHLLSISLPDASPEWAAAVGATYMRRLYFLQLGRVDALKRILPVQPVLHAPETACDMQEMQQHTLQPWARGVAELIFDARADMQPAVISAKLNPIAYRTPCAKCAAAVRQRVEAVVREWSAIKKTI